MIRHCDHLSIRERPAVAGDCVRSMPLETRAATANEEERSIDGVLSTEAPVMIFDWRAGEFVDEILLNSGAQLPSQLPLLAAHDRWSLDSVLGSARGIRSEANVGNGHDGLVGRLTFVKGDPEIDRIWNKTRQGHLRDLSVGYSVVEATELAPGTTAVVAGRSFTAGTRKLRVATRWLPKEVSLTPIGADAGAKTRSYEGVILMNPELRRYLESLGLRADASEADAITYYRGLTGEQRTRADALATPQPNTTPVQPAPTPTSAAGGGSRSAPPSNPAPAQPAVPPPQPEPARQAPPATGGPVNELDAERQRIREIHTLAGDDVPQAMVRQAVEQGWDVTRASREFLTAVRSARTPEGDARQAAPFAVHSRSRESDTNVRSLAAGLLASQNIDPTRCRMHDGRNVASRATALTEQDADRGDEFRRLNALDLIRECARLDSGRWYRDPEEAIRAAFSGATLAYVFSTNVNARLTVGWDRVGDTTVGWCDEEDVANFLEQEDISLTASARLDALPRGKEADHATVSDSRETYKIGRYAKQFVVDEQDVIDDRLGAILRMPEEMGEAARRLRPDLVYSILLENPTLVADSKAVFHADHSNLLTGALSDANLKSAISSMGTQRLNGDVLNITPTHLIVPSALDWTAQGLTTTASLAKLFADTSDPIYTTENLLARKRLVPVMDDRIGATGVRDPRSGATRTGSATNWFLVSRSSRGMRVAYRRGTNRQPQMRMFNLERGRWGIGWDINMDIGAAFMDYRWVQKSTGAA